jgi:transposase
MPRSHKAYPEEFKQKLIALVRRGRTPEELSREFEPSAQAIRNWVVQSERDAGARHNGLTTGEREEHRGSGLETVL